MLEGLVITRSRTAIIGLIILLTGFNNYDLACEALQYQPVEIYGSNEECALILDGPGRTSVFDYTYNLLRGNFPPTAGSHTCITYDAVNHAYFEARKRINVARPKNEVWRPEDLATVGELLLDISTNLAQIYGLTAEEIEKSLPLIDTSKTLIREVCPAFLSNVECRPGKYRRYDGLCTNLQNPTWGSTLSPFTRLMPPRFADGLSAPRIAVSGRELPLSRVVSRTMHPDEGYHDHAGTVMVIAWGQFMDHDYTLTGTPLDPLNRNDPEECCSRPPHLKNPYCNEILIPEDDYFYRLFNVKCMDFVRAFPAVRPGCRLGSRVPFNLLTGVLDGNTVYGITENFARKLRTGYGGLLRMNPVFSEYGLKDLLPLKLDIPDEGCTRPNKSMYCFEAGEIRVNEQLVLTCMHTLVAREHNRIAKGLARVNPHWDDETLFQESRRIVIAQIQHITYNEFLPILLGKDVMEKFGLLLEKNGYWDGYDPTVNPGVIDAFAAAAFRFGHSLLPTAVERWSKAHKFIASKRLSDLIRRPYDLYRAGVLDEYFMGLMNQVAQAMDDSITQEVTNHLFKKVGAKFGMDLVSFNMQRGREFGIPSYMEFRKYCGLPEANTFDELFGSMPNETIGRYSSIFEHPADVDLWSGGVSERPLPGSMLGPTFACVIATQFSHSRRGDRFWYELPNQPSSFTLDQLNEIRKSKLAKMICDNTDLIDTIQVYPMVLPDHEINPRVPCRSGVLPGIDLSKWAEFPTSHSSQYPQQPRKPKEEPNPIIPEPYARLMRLQRKLNPEKTQNSMNSLKPDPREKQMPLLWRRIVQTVTTTDILLPITKSDTSSPLIPTYDDSARSHDGRHVATKKFERSSNSLPDDVIELTKIVKGIRSRSVRNARRMNRSTYEQIKRDIAKKRTRRAVDSTAGAYVDSPKSENSSDVRRQPAVSIIDKLYRHPKLSYEDQVSERGRTKQKEKEKEEEEEEEEEDEKEKVREPKREQDGTVNQFNDFYKRIWDIINGTRPRFKIVVPPVKPSRLTQAVRFKDEHAVSASEVDDLNLPYDMTSSTENAGDRKSLPEQEPFDETRPSEEEDELGRYAKAEVDIVDDPSIQLDRLTNTEAPDGCYEDCNNADDESGSLGNVKEVDDQTAESPDEISSYIDDVDAPCKIIDESSNPQGSDGSNERLESGRYVQSEPEDIEKSPTLLPIQKSTNEKLVDEDRAVYDPDKIPYVEVPDYEDEREESLDEEDRRRAKEKTVNRSSKITNSSVDFVESIKPIEPVRSMEEENTKDRSNNGNFESYESTEDEETKEELETPEKMRNNLKDSRKKEEDEENERESKETEESLLSMINFDIDEYKKPFNLNDFLKNEPFFGKLLKDKDNVARGSKRDEPEEGNYSSTLRDDVNVDSPDTDERKLGYGLVRQDPSEERSNYEYYAKDDAGSEEIVDDDLYRYGDKDFFKRIFEETRRKRDNFEMSAEEEDFLDRYFTKDVVEKLKKDSEEGELSETRRKEAMAKNKRKKEMLKTLASILSKKDRISRLDDEMNKEIKDGQNTPSAYKNYWSLEYVLPGKKDHTSNNNDGTVVRS